MTQQREDAVFLFSFTASFFKRTQVKWHDPADVVQTGSEATQVGKRPSLFNSTQCHGM
ncbi:MAG: hypothetical protein AB3N12_10890 [Ruegeria sp.]